MRNTVAYSRTYATSLIKALRLLELFTRERPEWGVSELSVRLGTAKSTISRLGRTLQDEGFLMRAPNSEKFRLGFKLWELGSRVIGDEVDFSRLSLPHLENIVARVNESAQAVVLEGKEAVYVQKLDAPRSIRTFTSIGQHFPLHCTGTGKALLAYQSEKFLTAYLQGRLHRYTARTVIDPPTLRRELGQIAHRGYAVNRGEWREDIGGVAAPVYNRFGVVVGALGVTMPLARFPKDIVSPVANAVTLAARNFSQELGFLPKQGGGDERLRRRIA